MPRPLTTRKSDTTPPKLERDTGVQVLSRAAELLRLLKAEPAGLTQAEMAVRLGLARTTVHRILNALATEELVEPSGGGSRYRLGVEILRMADAARSGLVAEIHPHLQALSRAINETVDLSVLDRGQVTFIDQVVAPQRLRAVSVVGASFPLHCSANGKAILATMTASEAARLLPEQLEAHTPNTLISLTALQADLDLVRKRGAAVDLEEHSLGICALGVALRGTPLGLAAISVPIPVQRFAEKQAEATSALIQTVRNVETAFAR